jgi:iron complex transport system substrate-binding protein
MAGGQTPEDLRKSWHKWRQLTAVKNDKVFIVDADLFDRPTTRLVDGLEVIADLIHPEIFKQ